MERIIANSPAIENIFRKNKVVSAFLFGSAVKKRLTKLSDLDIAVVLDKTVSPDKYYQVRLSLLDQLGRIIKSKPLDIAVLNNASPLLVQLVITQGELIFCQNEDLKVNFQVRALQKFDDAFYLRKVYYHYLEKRVKENKLGEIYEK